VPEIEAIATDMLVQIEAEGLAEVIPTARAAQLTMNREGIRRLAAEELGLPPRPTVLPTRWPSCRPPSTAATAAGHRLPVHRQAGDVLVRQGSVAAQGPDDVQKAWDYAAAGGRVNQGRVIVEGFIDFDYEITLLTVRACDAGGTVQTYFCDPIGHVQVSGDYVESWQPRR
jgi:phosphoribosylglycinamide formyltransferase 2